jgi:hypothetical protein
MSGQYTEAIGTFNKYLKEVGKKKAREFGVDDLIKQCGDKKGAIADTGTKTPEVSVPEKTEIIKKDDKAVVNVIPPPAVIKDTASKNIVLSEYDRIMDQALTFQFKADSVASVADEQKVESARLPEAARADLRAKISANELLIASFRKAAEQKYSEAQAIINPTGVKVPQEEIELLKEQTIIKDTLSQSPVTSNDSIRKPTESITGKIPDIQPDTVKKAPIAIVRSVEVFSLFEVLPKPVSDPKAKIEIDPRIPDGLIYRIQIAVFRNPVAPSFFKGMTPIYGFKIAGTDKTTYYAGMFRRLADANKALGTVKAKGFKDSFIVALSGGKAVSSDRSVLMEKEWGKKPLAEIFKPDTETAIDTIPPTLTFRVEIMRSLKPVKDEMVEGIKKMVGNRGLDILSMEDGSVVYLIGKFITFESAAEYADLLKRNGYRDARVVAWLGSKEIPVDTARQLFENME